MKLFKIVMLGLFAFMLVACGDSKVDDPDKTPSFAGIEWGSNPADAEQKLKDAGFEIVPTRDEAAVVFSGNFMDAKTKGFVIFSDSKAKVGECYLFLKCVTYRAIPGVRDELVELYDENKTYEDKTASKVVVLVKPDMADVFEKYDAILAAMVKKYGAPVESRHEAGDEEYDALKLLQLELSRRKDDGEYAWIDSWFDIDKRGGAMVLEIREGMIEITYESVGFGTDLDEKEENNSSAL